MAEAPTAAPPNSAAPPGRLTALDVFRGLTIAGMVLVNNPGSWEHVYAPLRHAEWDGCTPTDLIFPFFLFIVGVSMAMSLRRWMPPASGTSHERPPAGVSLKTLRRGLLLTVLGLGLNALGVWLRHYPAMDWSVLRWTGVLQRIGACFLAGSLVVVLLPRLGVTVLIGVLLGGYHAALKAYTEHGVVGPLAPDSNLCRAVDLWVFPAGHLYRSPTDPEGLLSTLPALATTLLGFQAGRLITLANERAPLATMLLARGALLAGAGFLWSLSLPLNKALWTSSYVLFTAGLASGLLGLCIAASRVSAVRRLLWPFEVFGLNAIALFVGSGVVARLLGFFTVDGTTSVSRWTYDRLVASGLSEINASLAFALLTIGVWWVAMYVMYRAKWFLKV